MEQPLIQVRDLIKKFNGIVAIDNISFDVYKGEMFGLVGPDGAGKTTLIKLLIGLLSPNEGNINVLGYRIPERVDSIKDSFGYLSQKFSLYGDLTVKENIEFFAEIHRVKHFEAEKNRLLRLTNLFDFQNVLADNLSGGMKQKLALISTLVHKPKILFLDEPTTGVDPVSRREFWKILNGFVEEGITVVMSTPYLDEAERCHRIALIDSGKIIAYNSPQNIKSQLKKKFLEIVCSPVRDAYVIISEKTPFEVQMFGDRINVQLDNITLQRKLLLDILSEHKIEVIELSEIQPSLENIFIYILQKQLEVNASN